MRTFARVCYDFVVGDDWTIAAAVVVVLAVCGLLTRAGVNAWWWMPIGVLSVLAASVWRAAGSDRRVHDHGDAHDEAVHRERREGAGAEPPLEEAH